MGDLGFQLSHVFALGTLRHQCVVMLHHPTKGGGSFTGRNQTAHCEASDHRPGCLSLVACRVGWPGESRITFVRFEETLLPDLAMNHKHRNIELLEVLSPRAMVMAGDFQQDLNLGKGHIRLDTIDEGTKAFP